MKCYEVQVRIEGTIEIEDPQGPSYWRGSGCYTIDCRCWQDVVVTLTAESEEDARKKVDAHDFDEPCCDIEDIRETKVEGVEYVGESDEECFETAWGAVESYEDEGPVLLSLTDLQKDTICVHPKNLDGTGWLKRIK